MIQVSFLYPNAENSTFDFDYYINIHCPLSKAAFGEALKRLNVERGMCGIMPDSKPPFHAVGRLCFESVEAFYGALMPHIDELKADAAKYTNVEPMIQIGELID